MIINSATRLDIPALRTLWSEAFGDGNAFLDAFFDTAYSPERACVARLDGIIAGALYWFDCCFDGEKCAYIYAVATAKAHRGKGVCTALMRGTHAHLKALGYTGVILVPGAPSLFELYKKMGYKICSSVSYTVLEAEDVPCRIWEINKAEYSRLRREYLPSGGVIQESENLDFLERLATLYTGSDFVLAAYTEGDTLVGIELLGNTSAKRVASIACALGALKVNCRTPGDTTPFAMYLSLGTARTTPKYFGLAFD